MTKKSQGEIFGIALLFVVIIVGVLIYGKMKSLDPNYGIDPQTEGKYKILAEGSLNTLLKKSTTCYVERNKDTITDLINYCIENSYGSNDDPLVDCNEHGTVGSCTLVIDLLNKSLYKFFNTSFLGPIPFELRMSLPSQSSSPLNKNISNFGNFIYKNNQIVNKTNYRELRFKRANSGLRSWATAKRNINFELYLYYQ